MLFDLLAAFCETPGVRRGWWGHPWHHNWTFFSTRCPLPLLQWKRWSTLWPDCATAPPHPVAMPLAASNKWTAEAASVWLPVSCLGLDWCWDRLSPTHSAEMASVHTHTNTDTARRQNADGDLSTVRIRSSWQLWRPPSGLPKNETKLSVAP